MYEYLLGFVKYTSGYNFIDVLDPKMFNDIHELVVDTKAGEKIIYEDVEDKEIGLRYQVIKKIDAPKKIIQKDEKNKIDVRELRPLDYIASASVTILLVYGSYKIIKYVF